eukprot:1157900-Pelagomonas_calceolata.AAC.8
MVKTYPVQAVAGGYLRGYLRPENRCFLHAPNEGAPQPPALKLGDVLSLDCVLVLIQLISVQKVACSFWECTPCKSLGVWPLRFRDEQHGREGKGRVTKQIGCMAGSGWIWWHFLCFQDPAFLLSSLDVPYPTASLTPDSLSFVVDPAGSRTPAKNGQLKPRTSNLPA